MPVAFVGDFIEQLRASTTAADDTGRLDLIRALEELKSATAAVQAQVTADFVLSRRAKAKTVAGREHVEREAAAQVGRARRISPYQAQRYVGWSVILTSELPATFAELAAGRTSEWRATLVARETAWLSREHRAIVDADLAPELERLGDRRTERETRKRAYALDPAGAVARTAAAETERRVTLRPAPDAMTRLGALLPGPQGVATYAALTREVDRLIGIGQTTGRTRGQLMADILVERVTGQSSATDVPVEVHVVIDRDTLVNGGDAPASLLGLGPIPAEQARDLIRRPSDATPRWIRRLYRAPRSGELVAMDSRRRCFTPAQRHFIQLREEGLCTTPWCDAPIRHADHIEPAADDGPTSLDNGQGLCAACNYAKSNNHPSHAPPEEPAA